MANADGNTVADAFLALFADPIFEDAVLPADVAAALDELAHQAVRVVCNRLSGGTLDDATFAEPHLLDTQSGPIERTETPLPGSAGGTVIYPTLIGGIE